MKENWSAHHAQYLSFKDGKRYEQASQWRTASQTMYSKQYKNHLTRLQAENMRLMYDEELQLAIETAEAEAELLLRERQLASLRTMSLPELRATQVVTETATAPQEEYAFPVDDYDALRASVAEIVEQINSHSLE
jgi:hypothetical protein